MADISTYLADIMDAVYGEEVRGSIHDAIEVINDVGEVVLTIGTAVTSASSSIEGYYDGSLYINNSTWDLWKCDGSAWVSQGNIKGQKGDTGTSVTGVALHDTSGIIKTYRMSFSDGTYFDYQVADGESPVITEDITSNVTVGGIDSGTTIADGTTLTEVVKSLLVKEMAPAISFSASSSGVKEVGTSVTPTLTLTISSVGTGTPVSIAFYSGSTLLDTQSYVSGTSSYSFTMTDAITTTTTVKGILTYKKSDNTSATVEKTATYTFVMASYYGAVSTAPTDKASITALTKSVKNTKALTATFTLSNQKSCYCYPASFGNLSSIKDANNFEYINSYTKTSVTVDDVAYNVYTLTDPVTASGFKQIYS